MSINHTYIMPKPRFITSDQIEIRNWDGSVLSINPNISINYSNYSINFSVPSKNRYLMIIRGLFSLEITSIDIYPKKNSTFFFA